MWFSATERDFEGTVPQELKNQLGWSCRRFLTTRDQNESPYGITPTKSVVPKVHHPRFPFPLGTSEDVTGPVRVWEEDPVVVGKMDPDHNFLPGPRRRVSDPV